MKICPTQPTEHKNTNLNCLVVIALLSILTVFLSFSIFTYCRNSCHCHFGNCVHARCGFVDGRILSFMRLLSIPCAAWLAARFQPVTPLHVPPTSQHSFSICPCHFRCWIFVLFCTLCHFMFPILFLSTFSCFRRCKCDKTVFRPPRTLEQNPNCQITNGHVI